MLVPRHDLVSISAYVMVFLCSMNWNQLPVVVNFVDISGIVDHHYFQLSFHNTTEVCIPYYQWLAGGRWFSPVSSTNKTDHHDITEILLKVALNTITQPTLSIITLHPKRKIQHVYRWPINIEYTWKQLLSNINILLTSE